MAEPYRQLPAEKRRRILDAALEEFAKKDYKSASTDDIAARAGISKGLLFYYFKNKQSLDLLMYLADGYCHMQRMAGNKLDLDAMMAEYCQWRDMVKQYVYKEEYQ